MIGKIIAIATLALVSLGFCTKAPDPDCQHEWTGWHDQQRLTDDPYDPAYRTYSERNRCLKCQGIRKRIVE